jgi:hypothetical protein
MLKQGALRSVEVGKRQADLGGNAKVDFFLHYSCVDIPVSTRF